MMPPPRRYVLGGVLSLLAAASAVDHAKFRTCQQTGFCRRHRASQVHRPYVVAPNSLQVDAAGTVEGQLHGGPFGVSLTLKLLGYADGLARLRVTETNPLHGPRWEPDDILEKDLVDHLGIIKQKDDIPSLSEASIHQHALHILSPFSNAICPCRFDAMQNRSRHECCKPRQALSTATPDTNEQGTTLRLQENPR